MPTHELVVVSGKGGTGKTSVTASLAVLAGRAVLADGDVDASNLPLVLDPKDSETRPFVSGLEAHIDEDRCGGCGACLAQCRFNAIAWKHGKGARPYFQVDPLSCEGCGVCAAVCPAQCIDLEPRECGTWKVSRTDYGPMVHAELHAGAENSGRLVTEVRAKARKIATEDAIPLVLTDGPPGIGCPVIAAVTGAAEALLVTEPTPSGLHDLERILGLCTHFGVPAKLCVNKFDLNEDMTCAAETLALKMGATPLARIPYDSAVGLAQAAGQPVVRMPGPAAEAIENLWRNLNLQPAAAEH